MQPIIQPIQDFGQCLKQILAAKRVSASELARMMACKSRNTVFRILAGEGSHAARLAFLDRLTAQDPLGLTENERAALFQALEISRVGEENFMRNREMHELLTDIREGSHAGEAVFSDGEYGYAGLCDALHGWQELQLTITGCCDRRIFEVLRCAMADSACGSMTITHYIYTGADEAIGNISAIQPMLYAAGYTPYAIEPGMFSRERERLYRSNCIFMRAKDEHDVWYDQALLLVDKGVFCPTSLRAVGGFSLLEHVFAEDRLRMHPIKTTFAATNGTRDYLDYIGECAKLEHNRTILTIKRDVPISFVHPDMLMEAVLEGFRDTGFAEEEELRALVPQFYQAQLQRWENYFSKRRMTQTIFDRAAMERFARTGEQSDHFFAMRPYTPAERVRILANLREQTQRNPYFRIYFFRDGFVPPETEIGLYDGVGTLFSKPNTHYDLSGDHAEAIVGQPAFCDRFRDFFTQDLLEHHVIGDGETIAVLDALIAMAQADSD